MGPEVYNLVTQGWLDEFNPPEPIKGGRREQTPQRCPLNSTHVHPMMMMIFLKFLEYLRHYYIEEAAYVVVWLNLQG